MAETPEITTSPPAPAEKPASEVTLDPRPEIHRIRRATVVFSVVAGLLAFAFLTIRFSRNGLEKHRAELAQPFVRPLPPAQLEHPPTAQPPGPPAELGGGEAGSRAGAEATSPPAAFPPGAARPARAFRAGRTRRPALRSPMAARLEARRPAGAGGGGGRTRRGGGAANPEPAPSTAASSLDAQVAPVERLLANLGGAGPTPSGPSPRDPRVLSHEGSHAVRVSLARPLTPYVLSQGTYVPAVLAQALASDLAGPVRAYVARDVYDTVTGSHLLLPRGTLALGRQDRQPLAGESRLLVLWERLVFPDGRSLDLSDISDLADLPSAGEDGSLGLRGSVHRHWGSRLGTAALLALAGAGVQLSQPQRSASSGLAPDPGQLAAGELGLELGRLSEETLRQSLALPPTIELPAGAQVFLLLTRDFAFDAPYDGR